MILLCAAWRKTSVSPHNLHGAGADDVSQHLAGAHGGQLVDVTHDEQRRGSWHRLHQRLHQQHIDHRALVDDQQITVERVLVVALEAEGLGVELQQSVDGLGLHAGGLSYAGIWVMA